MKSLRYALWGVVATVVAILGFFYFQAVSGSQEAASHIGGPFKLATARGEGHVDSTTLAGKPYGIFFGFTHCPEVCPTTLLEMSALYEKLGDRAKDFRLFFVTVDPERDTAEFLRNYLEGYDSRIEGLVPTLEELPKLAARYRVFYEKVPTSDGSYTMNHTASVFLFDRRGKFSGTITYGENIAMRTSKVERLLTN